MRASSVMVMARKSCRMPYCGKWWSGRDEPKIENPRYAGLALM
jgi:hypothetical protein